MWPAVSRRRWPRPGSSRGRDDATSVTAPAPDEPAPPESTGNPKQVAWLSVGTVLIGVSGYVFLALIGHGRFDATDAAALSSVYLLSLILGPGLFVAVEQESSRLVSSSLAADTRPGPAARRSGRVAVLIAAMTLVLFTAAIPMLTGSLLNDEISLAVLLGVTIAGSAALFWLRGLAGGQRRFGSYAVTLLLDAGIRIVGCVGLAVAGVTDAYWFALAYCIAPPLAALIVILRPRTRQLEVPARPVPGAAIASFRTVLRHTLSLLVASAASMCMANLAPVVVHATLTTEPEVSFAFTTAVILTRVPLLLMGPVQAVVLPRLTAAVTMGDLVAFRRGLHRGLLIIGGIGVAAVIGALLLGRFAIELLFGPAADLMSAGRIGVLALAAAVQAAILLVQPGLVALRRHQGVLAGWLAGMVAFGLAFTLPLPPLDRATVAQLVGPVVTLAVHLLWVRTGSAAPSRAGESSGRR